MADKGASMTTDKLSCEWVRDWLPLLAGDGERVAGESGDVSAEDRRLLESHLGRMHFVPPAPRRPGGSTLAPRHGRGPAAGRT